MKKNLSFHQYGRHISNDIDINHAPEQAFYHPESVSHEQNQKLVAESLLAPAMQGRHQLTNDDEVGNFIPCRIYKNISYGAYGVTNNITVKSLFESPLAHGKTMDEMIEQAIHMVKKDCNRELLTQQMQEVSEKHTYLNRILMLLDFQKERLNHRNNINKFTSDTEISIIIRRLKTRDLTLRKFLSRIKYKLFPRTK